MFVKIDVFDVKTKVQKGPEAPTPICLTNNKEEGVELRQKMQGGKKISSFIWTLMVKQTMGKGHGMGWVNSEGVGKL